MMNMIPIPAFEELQASWPPKDKLRVSSDIKDLSWRDDHPLASQLAELCKGKPCSLPLFVSGKVSWVTFGGNQEELMEAIEDLRCWILPYLGKEESAAIVTKRNTSGPQEHALCSAAGWYFRWYCPVKNFKSIAKKLKALSSLLNSRPSRESKTTPSLSSLRLDFVAALRTGKWSAAKKAVDLIDQWQLDTARNTLLMRIRMLYEEGDIEALIVTIRRNEILDGELPSRVLRIVIDAIYQSDIRPFEQSEGWRDAFDKYQRCWQTRLAPYLIAQRSTLLDSPLSAYQAYSDCDRETLHTLFASYNMEIAGAMLDELPVASVSPVEVDDTSNFYGGNPPSASRSFWKEISSAVQIGAHNRSMECIADLTDAVLDDPEWISVGAETLLELFTDPLILGDPRSKVVAEEVLVAIVDTVINAKDFPRHEHSAIYNSLISAWVASREDSSLEQDGQLLLGLVGATIQCSAASISDCQVAIRTWWDKRKTLSRLPWLVASLDMLVQNHPNPMTLQNLWIDGAELICRLRVPLSKTERLLWQRLGRSVGLDDESIRIMIVELTETEERAEIDPLSVLNLHKVAVVTLNERAARQAAEEIKSRTGADVIIVTSKSADNFTRMAESADLILFVWASCTHAVYRAFDNVREKIQYVQGTGPSSIVLAAEYWAVHRQSL